MHDYFKYCNVASKVIHSDKFVYEITRLEVIELTNDGSEVTSFERKANMSISEDNDAFFLFLLMSFLRSGGLPRQLSVLLTCNLGQGVV